MQTKTANGTPTAEVLCAAPMMIKGIFNTSACFAGMIFVLAVLTSCSTKRAAVPTPTPRSHPEYIDLQAGWRLRVVTPLSKSGSYRLQYLDKKQKDSVVTLTADGFVGYETAYYAVETRRGGGVQVRFLSAELIRDGVSTALSRSIYPLFVFPTQIRAVRLIYLTRISDSDHDMAVIGSNRAEGLEGLTHAVLVDPITGCTALEETKCSWVPAGIAVRPERQRASDGGWVPAR